MSEKVIQTNAHKMDIHHPVVVEEACTIVRLLQQKNGHKLLSKVWSSIAFVALVISCQKNQHHFDYSVALKLSGLSKKDFQNAINSIPNIINLNLFNGTSSRNIPSPSSLNRSSRLRDAENLPSSPSVSVDYREECRRLGIHLGSNFIANEAIYLLEKMDDVKTKIEPLHVACAFIVQVKIQDIWTGKKSQFDNLMERIHSNMGDVLQEMKFRAEKMAFSSKRRKSGLLTSSSNTSNPVDNAASPRSTNAAEDNDNDDKTNTEKVADCQINSSVGDRAGNSNVANNSSVRQARPIDKNMKRKLDEVKSTGVNNMIPFKPLRKTIAYKKYIIWMNKIKCSLKQEQGEEVFNESEWPELHVS